LDLVPWPAQYLPIKPLRISGNSLLFFDGTNAYTNSGESEIRSCFYEDFLFRAVSPFVMQFNGESCSLFGDVIDGDVTGG
jgi:hypothetical protein